MYCVIGPSGGAGWSYPLRATLVQGATGKQRGRELLQKVLLAVDRFSTWVGQAFSWLIVALTLFVSWEVFSRYALGTPPAWAFDVMTMLYGTMFMMAGAYTLSKNGHVRGDVLYGFFRPRTQAAMDLTLYIVFFIPGVVALAWAGYNYAAESWVINEHSNITADGPLSIYPFKTGHSCRRRNPAAAGPGQDHAGSVICLRQGYWPSREQDVEEVDVDKLKQMVHVKDEDIEKLDKYSRECTDQMRKGLWFGFSLMAILIAGCIFMLMQAQTITNGHLGLLMLGLVVVAIMLGFPTAFTLMGMGMFFGWFAYRSVNPDLAVAQILDLMVQRTVCGDVERRADCHSAVRIYGVLS